MNSWFDSLESLQRLHDVAYGILICSLILGLLSTTALWLFGRRIDKLKTVEVANLKTKNEKIEKKFESSEEMRLAAEEKLELEIARTNKKIKPPTLSLFSNNIQRTMCTIVCTLRFESSKNQPLGTIQFEAQLPIGSKSKIIDFWPTADGGAFQSGPDSKQISENGRSARLIYSLMGAGSPTVKLTLTESSLVRIQGNYISNPIEIEAK